MFIIIRAGGTEPTSVRDAAKVFENYVADPSRLGDAAAKRIDQEGLYRTVCDYVAGMTDRSLMAEHARLTS